jgi:hypothetical protein
MRRILLQTPVQRSDQAPMVIDSTDKNILKPTYQELENDGLIIIKAKDGDENIQYLQIPHIFGEIFTSRVSSSISPISQFMNVKHWQEWERFNLSYLSFRHNLVMEESWEKYGNGKISLRILFQGALFSEQTGNTPLTLSETTEIRTCKHQFPLCIKDTTSIKVVGNEVS